MDLRGQLDEWARTTDGRLGALLPSVDERPAELHAAMRYSCLAPGKRIRPGLCLASALAVGGSVEGALDAACAIEMVHAFSLIHDDLPAIDDDDLRRGVPTCHVQFGEAVAILAGDALFALALDTLARSALEPGRAVRCLAALTSATRALVAGETTDVLSEGLPIDEDTLRFIHRHKTGALIAAACEIGAVAGGGSEDQIRALRAYGEEIGLAFQIADDVLNETSTSERLGKSAGSDRARGKATYPAFFGVDPSRAAAREAVERGVSHLRVLRPSPAVDRLGDLASYSIERVV